MHRRGIHINWFVLISSLTGYLVSLFCYTVLSGLGVNTESVLFENTATIFSLVLVAFIPSLFYFVIQSDFQDFKKETFNKIRFLQILVCVGISIMLWCSCTVLNALINTKLYDLGFEKIVQLENTTDISALILGFVATCIVAPVTEEFFYRGVLVSGYIKKGRGVAVVLSSFLFALAHGSVTIFAMPLIYGIVFAIVAIKTKSLLPSIIMHATCNVFSWIIFNAEILRIDTTYVAYAVFGLGVAGICLMLAFLLCELIKHFKRCIRLAYNSVFAFSENVAWIFIIIIYIFDNLILHGGLYG